MKLYYAPGACSLSPHIVAHEVDIGPSKFDLKSKETASGKDFLTINPKGYVPALELRQRSSAHGGSGNCAVPRGSETNAGWRRRTVRSSAIVCRKCWRSSAPRFTRLTGRCSTRSVPRGARGAAGILRKRFGFIDKALAGKSFLLGERFSVADAYLFVMVSWPTT